MKSHGSKQAVPRHRVQSRHSSDQQERSIEKQERQAAAAEIRAEVRELTPTAKARDGVLILLPADLVTDLLQQHRRAGCQCCPTCLSLTALVRGEPDPNA